VCVCVHLCSCICMRVSNHLYLLLGGDHHHLSTLDWGGSCLKVNGEAELVGGWRPQHTGRVLQEGACSAEVKER